MNADSRAGRDGSALPALPIYLTSTRSPGWWVMVFSIMVEAVAFASLFFAFFYLRASVPTWPPPGYSPPDLTLPSIVLGLLLLSAGTMYLGDSGIADGDRTRFAYGVGAAFVLGVAALCLIIADMEGFAFDWRTDAFGSIVWTTVAAWLLLLVIVLIQCAMALIAGWQGYYTRRRRLGVQMLALHWYHLVVIWVAVYLIVYISPRIS